MASESSDLVHNDYKFILFKLVGLYLIRCLNRSQGLSMPHFTALCQETHPFEIAVKNLEKKIKTDKFIIREY